MSSNSDVIRSDVSTIVAEKARGQQPRERACDQCKSRKIKCSTSEASSTSSSCLPCIYRHSSCTYEKVPGKRGPKRKERQSVTRTRSASSVSDIAVQSHSDFTLEQLLVAPEQPNVAENVVPVWSIGSEGLPEQYGESSDISIAPAGASILRNAQANTNDSGSLYSDDLWNLPMANSFPYFDWAIDEFFGSSVVQGNHQPTFSGSTPIFAQHVYTLANMENPASRQPDITEMASFASPSAESEDFSALLTQYTDHLRPSFPILDVVRLQQINRLAPSARPSSYDDLVASIRVLVHLKNRPTGPGTPSVRPEEEGPLSMMLRWSPTVRAAGDIDFYKVMTSLHLFVGWALVGEMMPSWYRLQEVMTLATLCGITDRTSRWYDSRLFSPGEIEEKLRFVTLLVVCERATVVLHNLPPNIVHPMRLADDTADFAAAILRTSEKAMDIIYLHLLFKVVRAEHAACWREQCGPACDLWTAEKAREVDSQLADLHIQFLQGDLDQSGPGIHTVQHTNRTISIYWLHDRCWNIFRRHGLIHAEGQGIFGYAFILDNLTKAAQYCASMRISDFDLGLDCASKLADMGMTAISLLNDEYLNNNSAETGTRSGLMSAIFQVIGFITALNRDGGDFVKNLLPSLKRAMEGKARDK